MLRGNRYEYLMYFLFIYFCHKCNFVFGPVDGAVFTRAVGQQSKTDSQVLTGEMNELMNEWKYLDATWQVKVMWCF